MIFISFHKDDENITEKFRNNKHLLWKPANDKFLKLTLLI